VYDLSATFDTLIQVKVLIHKSGALTPKFSPNLKTEKKREKSINKQKKQNSNGNKATTTLHKQKNRYCLEFFKVLKYHFK